MRLPEIKFRCSDILCRGAMCERCYKTHTLCAIGHHGTVTEPVEPDLYVAVRRNASQRSGGGPTPSSSSIVETKNKNQR